MGTLSSRLWETVRPYDSIDNRVRPLMICWLAPDIFFWGRTTAARAFVHDVERAAKPAPHATPGETEYVNGKTHGGRIDTLGRDETIVL